ncbi:hypothetical protein H4R18_004993 [Coemansia javaensis]|uniref:Uncharacterized protein n=1 Tax=Coemansia javaensis TaxID=2761396 RepID=A0A9W8H2T4_9FUNG|nr:hypothetical protein H4R18_004993 [Coemansia javaensis]
MFAVLFSAVVLELLASMGTFGALAAQNLFTNSAAGWYVRLDWTAVYTYAVSMLSVIVSFSLALGGLTRSAPPGKRCCSLLFSPLAIFVTAFVFSILWVVIVGSAYRNPLPMKYPCDIFRHLRGSLQMLGLVSGRSLIDEGADGYSRDISPRPAQRTATHEYQPHSPRRTPDRQIDDNGDPDPASDSAHDLAQEHEDNVQYRALYVPDNGAACCAPYGQHYEVHRHSPTSQSSRRQRLRQMFGRDADQNE